jgi:DNA-binding NarL/FixJ family response regulator
MNRLRVLMAGDMASIRRGGRSALQLTDDMEIAGEADTVEELARLASDLTPDAVVIDQDLPHGDCLAAIRTIKQRHPDTQIVVMTDQLDDVKALEAIEAGATGYILKDIPGTNLATAIRSVCSGRGFLHPAITGTLAHRLSRLIRRRGWHRARTSGLTGRELDILMEVAQGRTDDEIARQFVVTPGTIKTHVRHILRKLSARNRAQAVAHVLRKGLIK